MRVRADRVPAAAGIAAAAVYAAGDVLSGLLYQGYSHGDQAISELSALGSPVRGTMVAFLTVHGLLLGTFAVGVWRAGSRTPGEGGRALRWAAGLLLAAALVGLVIHPFFPMSSRGMAGGFNDTMHMILTGVFVLLVLPAVVLVAVASRGWMRRYSLGSVVVMAASGALAAGRAPRDIELSPPTPSLGVFERVNAYAYLAWLVVLAVTVPARRGHLPPEAADGRAPGARGRGDGRRVRSRRSPTSPRGR